METKPRREVMLLLLILVSSMLGGCSRGGQHIDTSVVVAAETVGVPAGRFPALNVVREAESRDSDEIGTSSRSAGT